MKRTILISGLTATLLMGCSEMKKMDDMKNNTSQMKETTTKMNDKMAHMDSTTTGMDKKMAQMNDTTTHMDETTTGMSEKMTAVVTKTEGVKAISEELYDTIRQGNSVTLRRDGYAAVLNAPTLFKKISEANKYFMSFEFQIWNSHGQDLEPNQRDILGQQAAQEFFTEIEGLAERDNSVNPLANPDPVEILVDPSCAENREASFNAFAMALHQVNRKEVRAETQNSGLKRMTMYSMMEDALLAPRNMPQAGYIREILAHEEKAIQILQTRYNIFPLVFIDAVSKLTDK
ncbi:MAG TPA: hypothetical protein VN132_05045, partial [Bdellovibrio sp.]|nr:hypothetical protein [Bdellovibrio sp.]